MELELELLNFDLNLGEVMALDLQLEHLEGIGKVFKQRLVQPSSLLLVELIEPGRFIAFLE